MEPALLIFHIPDPNKCVFGPVTRGHVQEFTDLSKTENVGQTISDPGQMLILYTLPSIWPYPFFQVDLQIMVFRQNRSIPKTGFVFVLYCLLVLPVGPC